MSETQNNLRIVELRFTNIRDLPKSERLILFSLSRINTVLNFYYHVLGSALEKDVYEYSFFQSEILIGLMGTIFESLQYYTRHASILNESNYSEADVPFLRKVRAYFSEVSIQDSFVNKILKLVRNKYSFHYDDDIYENADSLLIEEERGLFAITKDQTSIHTFYALPAMILEEINEINNEYNFFEPHDLNGLNKKLLYMGLDILRFNEKYLFMKLKDKLTRNYREEETAEQSLPPESAP